MTPSEAKRLIGRTIVAVDLDATWEGEGLHRRRMHSPRVFLDDGSQLYFVVEEHPDGGEYGVDIGITRSRKSGPRCKP